MIFLAIVKLVSKSTNQPFTSDMISVSNSAYMFCNKFDSMKRNLMNLSVQAQESELSSILYQPNSGR